MREALEFKSSTSSVKLNLQEPIMKNYDNNGCINIAKKKSQLQKRSQCIDRYTRSYLTGRSGKKYTIELYSDS